MSYEEEFQDWIKVKLKDLTAGEAPKRVVADPTYALQMLLAMGHSVSDLLEVGCAPKELFAAGVSVKQLYVAGCTLTELLDAGFTLHDFRKEQFSIEDHFRKLVTPRNLYDSGMSVQRLIEIGYPEHWLYDHGKQLNAKELYDGGISLQMLRIIGVHPREMVEYVSVRDLCDAGFSEYQLLEAGVSREIRHGGGTKP
jgi:hypothetical protein